MPFKRPLGERVDELAEAPYFIRPLQDKRVVVGQDVLLECQVEGHPDPVVKWLKDDHDVTQCPDYQISSIGVKHHLAIKNVQASDNGRFTIQAMNAAGTKQSTCMLIVAPAPTPIPGAKSVVNSPAPPQTPVGPSAPLFLKELKNLPLKPGSQVILEARVVGTPIPQIEWLKNKAPLKNYRAKTEYSTHTGICALIIPQMFADDIGEYTCRASNSHGIAETSAQLLPRDEFERWFHEQQSLITSERRQKMLAQTQKQQQKQVPLRSGRSNAQSYSAQHVQQQQQKPQPPQRSKVPVNNSSEYDSISEIPWGISESETEPELALLDLRGIGSLPQIQVPLRGLRLTEGTDAILQCNVTGNPKPKITWLKNGKIVDVINSKGITVLYKGSLAMIKISSVLEEDSGEYTLLAENIYGAVESSARVDVYPLQLPNERVLQSPLFLNQQQQQQQQLGYQLQYGQTKHQDYQTRGGSYQAQQIAVLEAEQQRQFEAYQKQLQQAYQQQQQQLRKQRQALEQQQPIRHPPQQPQYAQRSPQQEIRQTQVYHFPRQQFQYNQREQVFRLGQQPQVHRAYQLPSPAQLNSQLQYQKQYDQHHPQRDLNYIAQRMPQVERIAPQQQYFGGQDYSVKSLQPKPAGRADKPPQFSGLPNSVTVKAGENITFTAKATGHPLPRFVWRRSDGSTIATGGRYRVELSPDGTTKLNIEKCTKEDTDTYLCIAENEGGAVQSRCSLNVIESKPGDAPQFVGKFQSVTIYEGDSLTLYCKATGDKLKMSWSKDGTPIKSGGSFKVEDKGNGESTLQILKAKMADGGWYQCVASNQSGTSSLKGRIVVQSRQKLESKPEEVVHRKVDRRIARYGQKMEEDSVPKVKSKQPPKFTDSLKSQHLIEGQTALLDCKYTPTDDSNLKIAWLLNGKAVMASSRVSTLTEGGYAALKINPVTSFDKGEYTIIAVNTLGEARQSAIIDVTGHRAALTDASNVTVVDKQTAVIKAPTRIAEMPNFHTELRSMEVFSGQHIHLEAKISPADDPNLKIVWLINGKILQPNDKIKITYDYGFVTLDIFDVTDENSGTYTCQVTNVVGTMESNATVIVQPSLEESVQQERNIIDVEDAREMRYQEGVISGAPIFLTNLQNCHCDQELGRSYFEARIAPVNDPTLKVIWLKDGQPLPNANRIQTFYNFGFVSLTLNPTYPEDAGVYTCILKNLHGQSQSVAQLTTVSTSTLQLDSKHEQSLAQIGYLEGQQVHIGPPAVERPEEVQSLEQPRFARKLGNTVEVNENDPVHFEARIQPANDVKMVVEWYHNGAPLPAAHRFRPMFDFGYVALDILYAFPEDSGTYTLIARNELGEVQSTVELIVNSDKTLYLDAHHPEGLERIQELERSRIRPLEHPADRECDHAPRLIGDLNDLELKEGENINFALRVEPVNDPTMIVEWFLNGQLLPASARLRTQYEFGYLSAEIHGGIPEDSGIYTARATNALGEASKECRVLITPYATILSETQHEESLGKIRQIENLSKYGREEIEDQGPQIAPHFVRPLPGDIGEVEEGVSLHLECQISPVNDNTMQVTWLKNGKPIPTGHRFRVFHDFGFISLDILDVSAEDSGAYACIIKNALGQTESRAVFICKAKGRILEETQHPNSVARIQEIEAPKPVPQEAPDAAKVAPRFIKEIGTGEMLYVKEGDNVYLEAQVTPLDDNTLNYEWLLNGRPLMKAHRFVLNHDFGFIGLNILYMYPEDSGTYTLVVRNAAGEARSVADIDCAVKGSMITESFHPNSIQRIRELEMPLQPAEEKPEAPRMAPEIVRPLPPALDTVHESQTLHLEAQILPVDDNQLRVEWLHNGQPLAAGSRYRLLNDFGFVSLDIDYIIGEDAGTYMLVVTNTEGRAETSTTFDVERLKSIYMDTAHPESLRRIQEIEAVLPPKPSEEELVAEMPHFTQPLSGPNEVVREGQSVHMDCVVQPINDPNLKIEWFLNGYPIMFGSRIRTMHDFGYVGLEFLHIHPEDSGTYTCKASNAAGEAVTEFFIECKPRRNVYLETQHEESWQKIQDMENRVVPREPSPDLTFPPPTFTVPLQNVDGVVDSESVRLECRLQPINDPTLKVYWTKNGLPLPEGSRFMPARNLEYVTLDLLAVYGDDSGVYSCKAVSDFGEAVTSCTVKCQPTDSLLLDTHHQESWNQIQDMESRRPEEPIYVEPEKISPVFVVPLPAQVGDFKESEPVHIEGQIEPTNDNELTVEWYHNGHPLANGHRFRKTHDFGYVSLDILYVFPEDDGEWTCVARNSLGEAQSTAALSVRPRKVIYDETQHPESLRRIEQLEAPKEPPPEPLELKPLAPQFILPLQQIQRIEGQPVHFETRVTPINDPTMIVQWFKDGQPLMDSNRFQHTTDFGFIGFDIAYSIPEDGGIYTCVATNEEGQDQVEGSLEVRSKDAIIQDTQHEASWEQIQMLERPKEKPSEEMDEAAVAPHFIRQLNSVDDLIEGQPAHFEANYEPINDPKVAVLWFFNGRPLAASSRITMRNEFGLVTLDIHYVLPEDTGEFRCLVRNVVGEDQTAGTLQSKSRASILADVQHPESWKRIQEIEAPKAAVAEPEPTVYMKPSFTQPLQSIEIAEGDVAQLEARLIPVNDPKLQIIWFHNDAPLQQSSWHTMTNDFGCVSLRISPVYPHHSGVYSCKAVNDQGVAVTSATVTIKDVESIQRGTRHPDSLQKIQEIESIDKFPRLEAPEAEFCKPNWVKGFDNIDDLAEGEIVQLTGYVEPVGDPNMRIEWFLNGAPLQNSNRYRHENDFGNVMLTIVHVLPQDSGVYTCKATNRSGDASTSATVKVAGYESIVRGTQHPVSWEKIQVLETPIISEEVEEVVEKEKPRFLTQLESVTDAPEGAIVHLEATFQPARDPDLKVIWLKNGQPLGASQLIRTRSELGWATLDINGVNLDHNGVYTLKIVNSEGEAASSATIKVVGIGDILSDTAHEESWRRIQEIEAPKEKTPEPLPTVYDAPTIVETITDVECDEGEPSHFQAMVSPTNDPNLQIVWLRNGQLLAHGSKYAITNDFGFCTLDIGYTYPEDQGVYQLRVTNENGESVTSATLKCHPKEAIYRDTQHVESWKRIQEIEAPKEPLPEMVAPPKMAPRFLTELQSIGDIYEGQPAHFEATIEPIDDPDLKMQWYLNGAPVSASSRVKMINDFGWIIMDINSTEPRDSGEWTCIISNEVAEAKSSASMNVLSKTSIILDSIQPQSLERIREMEAFKSVPEEVAPKVYPAPHITLHLQKPEGLGEGDSTHLEARFTPTDDPHLKVEWFRNGQPLYHANRFKMVQDFGFAILDILHLYAQDAGEYMVRISNDSGEASSTTSFDVATKESLLLQPLDVEKAQAVQELEHNLHLKPVERPIEEQKTVPVFITPLSAPVVCDEGDRVHFTARYEPVNDNQLQILWFLNGKALKTSSRVKTINDFGIVVLEISPTYPEDSGEYTCRAFNKVGEAVTSTELTCNPKQKIITQSQLPDSMSGAYRKIVEIEAPKASAPEKPVTEYGPPRFLTELKSLTDLSEGQLAHLEVQVEPVADSDLKIEWFHDGKPLKHTARMKAIHDFGFVVLELTPVEPQDSGTWICRATNKSGQAETSCDIKVAGTGGIITDWQLNTEEGKDRIGQLEEWIHRPKEDLDFPEREYDAPYFTQNLEDLGQMNEAEATAFTCVLQPIGDPTLRIEWLHNGHAIPYSNRIHMSNDFGVATLLIKHLIAEDSGEYKCIARNSKGQAETVGHIEVVSLTHIDVPTIIQMLFDRIENVQEGESVHMECRVAPINDPKLTVHWLKDGEPLPEASRFRPSAEFGYVTLDILYAYPEDSGVYECIVVNDKGEASTKTHVTVLPKPSLDFATQAPSAHLENLETHMRQHTTMELTLTKEDGYEEAAKQPPEFKAPLTNVGVEEGEFCRFETQLAPINDPYMKIEWFKDNKPVLIGHRFRSTLDFGFVCLDLLYALPDDTGEYVCVATNPYGQARVSAKLACSGTTHIITDPQLPQGVLVADVKKLGDQPYWLEQASEQTREKQPPRFTIKPVNIQAVENEPARFECAVVGNPKPKVIWYINGNQAIHGHRYKLTFDGIYYLTISNTKISDAGEILAIAKNSEGEVLASAMLDVFQKKDFRHVKLRPTSFKTIDELHEREATWQKETLGSLGEAFEKAPKPDQQRLMRVERSKTPIEPLESEELIEKFTRPKDEQFYDQLTYVETTRPTFEGLKLAPVTLKPGQIEKYEPPKEEMEKVDLKPAPVAEKEEIPAGARVPKPEWATEMKLGNVESRFHRFEEPEKEVVVPAREQVKLKEVKPSPSQPGEHVEIEKNKAKLAAVVQAPEIPKEAEIPAKDQVKIKQKFQPKIVKPSEAPVIAGGPLKEIPPVVKPKIEETVLPSKPQPVKLGQSQKVPPQITEQLKPAEGEVGRSVQFRVGFTGDQPITVVWYRDGREIKPSFEFQIVTTVPYSILTITKLKVAYSGEYVCRLTNVAGTVESLANLTVVKAADRGVSPDFKERLNDLRIQQNSVSEFRCVVVGTPEPTTSWFKDGKPLPNDERYKTVVEGNVHKLIITVTLPKDAGIYECVAKNATGEARCKARLNIILAKTGKDAEAGPRLEAPRFQTQIQPVVVPEGSPAEFRAKYTGFPEPMIRWYRNNEPLKKTKYNEMSQSKGEALLRITECYQDDVAEYKCEATNPAGKATSVANLLLQPKEGSVMRTPIIASSSAVGDVPGGGAQAVGASAEKIKKMAPSSGAPQFISKLSDIAARQGHTVKFVAEISGNPQPTVAWQFNGKPIYDSRDHKISLVGNKAILELQRITEAQAGDYAITIRNPLGAAQSQAKLKIQYR